MKPIILLMSVAVLTMISFDQQDRSASLTTGTMVKSRVITIPVKTNEPLPGEECSRSEQHTGTCQPDVTVSKVITRKFINKVFYIL